MNENNILDDTSLTEKTLCLMLLQSGKRLNFVFNFNIDEIIITNVGVTVTPSDILNTEKGIYFSTKNLLKMKNFVW